MTAGPTGMPFVLDSNGVPQAQAWPDGGANSEIPFASDFVVVVTGVGAGISQATVAALIVSSPLAIPLPFGSKRFKIAYASLGAPCTAQNF